MTHFRHAGTSYVASIEVATLFRLRGWARHAALLGLSAQEYLIHNREGIEDRPTVLGRRERFELTLASLARDGLVAHRSLPGHDGHEDSSLPEVLNPYGIS